MIQGQQLRQRLTAGDKLFGVANSYPAPGLVELMCQGWDFLWLDAQHGQFTLESMLNNMRAAEALGVATIVRVLSHEPASLGQWADTAPAALMIPMLNTADEARAVVKSLRFPPRGTRSFGGRRIGDVTGRTYWSDPTPLVIAQIETTQAMENAAAIASVDGIDVLMYSPSDMKLSLGLSPDASLREHPILEEQMAGLAQIARKAGKWAMGIGLGSEAAMKVVAMGYQLIVAGTDSEILGGTCRRRLKEIKDHLRA